MKKEASIFNSLTSYVMYSFIKINSALYVFQDKWVLVIYSNQNMPIYAEVESPLTL